MSKNPMLASNQRFWIVSEQYYPQETATGYLLTQLAESVVQQQLVEVICGKPGRSIVGVDVPREETRNGVLIHRCAATSLNKDVLFFRLINIVTQSVSLALVTLRYVQGGDTLLVVTNPPTLPFLIVLACRIKGVNSILLIYDVYPEAAIAAGVMKKDGVFVRLANYMSRLLYRNVQSIVVLGRDMRELALKKLHGYRQNVVVIPNWADIDTVYPTKREENSLLQELGLTDKFVIQYAGNMSRVNDLESIIQCAEQFKNVDDIHFLFIGSGAKKHWLKQTTAERKLDNVTILPSRPRSDQNNFLNACDIAIASLNKGMVGVSVPSRTYNIMAAGKPLIGIVEEKTEVALLIAEEKIGWVAPPGQPSRLVHIISDAYSRPEQLFEMGLRSRSAAERLYTLGIATQRYVDVITYLNARGDDPVLSLS